MFRDYSGQRPLVDLVSRRHRHHNYQDLQSRLLRGHLYHLDLQGHQYLVHRLFQQHLYHLDLQVRQYLVLPQQVLPQQVLPLKDLPPQVLPLKDLPLLAVDQKPELQEEHSPHRHREEQEVPRSRRHLEEEEEARLHRHLEVGAVGSDPSLGLR